MLNSPEPPPPTPHGPHPRPESPPPSPPTPTDRITFLPPNALATILHEAGPHAYLVCRTFRALQPPPPALAPHGISDPTPLITALATLPPTVTSLDLRGCTPPNAQINIDLPHPITPAALATLVATLPNLQHLKLPSLPTTLLPATLNLLHACPHLHTFSSPSYFKPPGPPSTHSHAPPPPAWAPLLHPPATATRLRSLTLPTSALPTLLAAPPASFPHLASASFGAGGLPSVHLHDLASLPAVAPALRSLKLRCRCTYSHPEHLTAFSTLTALTLRWCTAESPDHPMALFLHHVGALTALRSLTFSTLHTGWTPAEAGWLARLTNLTRLCTAFGFDNYEMEDGGEAVPVTTEVAAAAGGLPLLQELHVGFQSALGTACKEEWLACGQPTSSFFHHLASATQLRRLCLENLPLPAEASLLASLQGLTALQLRKCTPAVDRRCNPLPLAWLAALTNLQQLSWYNIRPGLEGALGPQLQPLAALPCLRTLSLVSDERAAVTSGPMLDMLGSLGGRLERLELGGWWLGMVQATVPGVVSGSDDLLGGVLAGMSRLRVLDLGGMRGEPGVVQWLRLPAGLRQCYVHPQVEAWGELEGLRARCPWVSVRAHGRFDNDVW